MLGQITNSIDMGTGAESTSDFHNKENIRISLYF